jgi:hypothetical protein
MRKDGAQRVYDPHWRDLTFQMNPVYSSVLEALADLEWVALTAFSASCAERAVGVFDKFRGDSSSEVLQSAVRQVWAIVDSGEAGDTAGQLQDLFLLPEGAVVDPEEKEYYAMRAVRVVVNALMCARSNENLEHARQTSKDIVGLAAELESTAEPAESDAPDALEAAEVERQRLTIRFLQSEEEADDDLRTALNAASVHASSLFDARSELVTDKMGWSK